MFNTISGNNEAISWHGILINTLKLNNEINNRGRLIQIGTTNFTFPKVNFPFISRNIPAAPAYVFYISQVICYSRYYAQYSDFLDIAQLLMLKLLNQGYNDTRLNSSLWRLNGHHHEYADLSIKLPISQMTTNMFHLSKWESRRFLIHDL